MKGVLIIPTGLNCALGGDASYLPGVKLIAGCVDELIVNPNAVNASDINEIPPNALYVEGSTIDRFLEGKLNLCRTKTYNKILLAVNPPVTPTEINAMNAGIWGLGADIHIVPLKTPLEMKAIISEDGIAAGTHSGIPELIGQLSLHKYDALAIQSHIECDIETEMNYWNNGGVNPWGGIEAIVSKLISEKINKPVSHAPCGWHADEEHTPDLVERIIVEKSMAPEIISYTYIFCVFKGLHRAPRLEPDLLRAGPEILNNSEIDFLISPHGCWGRPHEACSELDIPIIVVEENTTCFSKQVQYGYYNNIIFVKNYLEAAGVIMAMNNGVNYKTCLLGY